MKLIMRVWGALIICLAFAAIAAAQDVRVSGQVVDRDGKPWPGVTVVLKSDAGRNFTLKTDKDGKYTQIGLSPGVYTFTLTELSTALAFTEKHQLSSGQDNVVNFNFKLLASQQGPSAEQQKQQSDAANQFKGMKAHVDAGLAALADSDGLRKQLKAAPDDQKPAIQDNLNKAYQTAVTELQQAEQAVGTKDVKNHAVIWSNLGVAYNLSGRYDDGVNAYQKAIELNPQPNYYVGLSSALANSAASQTDPAAVSAKIADAGANCDKAAALAATPNPAESSRCWKNIGIVLSNKGDLKDAVAPLQKATQADPKDGQTWYLLGSAFTGMIDSKQEGDKMTYVIPPGTADAYQKCIDVDPNGPYAATCKTMLDSLATMAGGESTAVGTRKPTTKKK